MARNQTLTSSNIFDVLSEIGASAVLGGGFLILSSLIREVLGLGSLFGIDLYTKYFSPIGFFATPAGGFLIAALGVILYRLFVLTSSEEKED